MDMEKIIGNTYENAAGAQILQQIDSLNLQAKDFEGLDDAEKEEENFQKFLAGIKSITADIVAAPNIKKIVIGKNVIKGLDKGPHVVIDPECERLSMRHNEPYEDQKKYFSSCVTVIDKLNELDDKTIDKDNLARIKGIFQTAIKELDVSINRDKTNEASMSPEQELQFFINRITQEHILSLGGNNQDKPYILTGYFLKGGTTYDNQGNMNIRPSNNKDSEINQIEAKKEEKIFEKKYTITELPSDINTWDKEEITQVYIKTDKDNEIMLREIQTKNEDPKHTETFKYKVKTKEGDKKAKNTFKIGPRLYQELSSELQKGEKIKKTRYTKEFNGYYITIDVFNEPDHVTGKMLAEVKSSNTISDITELPDFLKKELSEDEANKMKNVNIALKSN